MPLLADFGLSRVLNIISQTSKSSSLLLNDTTTNNRGGAIRWLAPELLGLDKTDDDLNLSSTRASDVYSFAMVIIEVWISPCQ